ncbi:response regulator [Paenibacillus rigui]|uniref:DNA-binding response regulator n=1 Tax=Paenibacillus rigui TaxID=554312 RepID=A0A229UV83_9BACL|nr:response regulator [Paenibacillus rigui]OXM87328.1 DNA-binding response regulator [Paenibacillus rigui]
MLRVLIAEDEDMIRDKIRNNIDWQANGFGEIYEAGDGNEAWRLFLQHRPEIVITDIQMPEMNGIELTKLIKQGFPECRVIIISGHAEFDYAVESIRLNVYDYILKPFQCKNLLIKILKAKKDIEYSQHELEAREEMRRQLIENREMLREKFFRDLLSHCVVNEPLKQISYLGLNDLQARSYHVIALQIDSVLEGASDEDLYITNLMLYQWLERETVGKEPIYLVINYKLEQLVLIGFDHIHALTAKLEQWIERAWMEKGCRLTAGIGGMCASLQAMYGSYQEACTAVTLSKIHGRGIVYTISDLNSEREAYSKQLQMLVDHQLYGHMKYGLFQDIKNDVDEILFEIKNARMDPEACGNVINHMLLLAYKAVNELGFNAFQIIGRAELYRVNVGDFEDFEMLRKHILHIFQQINQHIHMKHNNRNVSLVITIKQYLDEHYNEHITLTSLAKEFKISPSYLSLLFREQTSLNFIDYLTKIRIDKAKELLRTSDLRNYEIAERIGYRDAHYFSAAFKKAVGTNPTEYREYLDHKENV